MAFFGTPVAMGLVLAFSTGQMWFLLVLAWPALWLMMWIFR